MSSVETFDELNIEAEWDIYNTSLLTQKLYRHVRRGDFNFNLEAGRGSLLADFLIGASSGLAATMAYDLMKYLAKRRVNQELRPAYVYVVRDDVEYGTHIRNFSDVEELQNEIESAEQGISDSEDDDDDEDMDAAAASDW